MKFLERIQALLRPAPVAQADEPPLGADEDPFDEPVVLEISDVIDLHPIPPRQVRAVVEAYLIEAHARGFRFVRLIHGKGIGVQRQAVRAILDRTPFVIRHHDAPPDAGGPGATIAELTQAGQDSAATKNGQDGQDVSGFTGSRIGETSCPS
ncbi:MAG: Smr/MutS family protein [Blastocatellia bacterium]|nr:Smr/MutS family protein [Blastocatellia bacterium]